MNRELCYLSAADAMRRFRAGSLSPVDLMSSVLEAAYEQQASANATTVIHADAALEGAQLAAQRYRDGTARPLEGIPVAVKDESAVAGWTITNGSTVREYVADKNHPMVDRLVDAGAIPHVQTTTPEFSCLGQTWSRRWGVTRNPWNLHYTCSGSSGGTAAALAAGCAPIGTGSDMAGSIRLPAAFQGLYGYKPPLGRVPTAAGDELFAFATEGPLARSFDDLVAMQNVIAGPHPATYAALPAAPLPTHYDDLSGWKIAFSATLGSSAISADVEANLHHALDGLRRRGAIIEPVAIDWDLKEIAETLIEGIFGIYFGDHFRSLPDDAYGQLNSYVRMLWDKHRDRRASLTPAAQCAAKLQQDMHAKVWSQGYRALLCPASFTTALRADFDPSVEPELEIAGKLVESYLGWAATPPFNLLSRSPVISVPTGFGANHVPTGMQIVAPSYRDEVAFQIAANHAAADHSGLYTRVFPDFRSAP
jgi:amidase